MRKLIINTGYPTAVHSLLLQHEFAERGKIEHRTLALMVDYPDDVLSQALVLWFSLAKGCGLVDSYQLVKEIKEAYEQEDKEEQV